nr:phosphoglycolate phosphatase [Parashewanella hymeniacidonis]
MSRFKAIAFDLDGTLVDSVPDIHAGVNDMLLELQQPIVSQELMRSWVGNGVQKLVERALINTNGTQPTVEELSSTHERFMHHYGLHLNKHSDLYEHVKSTLASMKKQGYRLAIVTNKPYRFVPDMLEAYGIDVYFELVLGGDSLEKCKPDPLPLNHIISEWNLEKTQLLMVGDSKNDIFAAKSAGVASIGLTYGYNYGEDIGLCGPDAVFDQFRDILTWVNAQS